MLNRTLGRAAPVLAATLCLCSAVRAQEVEVTRLVISPKTVYTPTPGITPIPLFGPPGAQIHGLMSENGDPLDDLTLFQLANSGVGNMDFVQDGIAYTMSVTLDANGEGELAVELLNALATYEDPRFIELYATVDSLPGVAFVETVQIMLLPPDGPDEIDPTCCENSLREPPYRGPGDTVPPFFPGPPFADACDGPITQGCQFTPDVDPPLSGADVTTINALTFAQDLSKIDMLGNAPGCFPLEGVGDIGFLTYGDIWPIVFDAQTEYIEFTFKPAHSERTYETAFMVPVVTLQAYCLEWLWLRNAAQPGQMAGVFEGTREFSTFFLDQEMGFRNNPFGSSPWNRAHGSGAACLSTLDCGYQLRKQRIRFRTDCLRDIILANIGFLSAGGGNNELFVFGGVYCPLPPPD